jgi:hypothetical protein
MTLKYKHYPFLFFLLFIGINTTVHAQGSAVLVKSTMYPFKGWNGSHGGHHIITVGSKELDITSNLTAQNVIQYNLLFIDDEEYPNLINCRGFTFGNNTGDCSIGEYPNPLYNILYNKLNFNEGWFEGCIGESEIYGIHLPQPSDNQRCITENINLELGWNWQYSYDDISWSNFPELFQTKRTISFKINELNGYTGKNKIHFRTGYGTQFTKSIQYDIIGCSPELDPLIPPYTENQSCSDKKDGQVTFFFNRSLENGETFLFSRTLINSDGTDGPVTSTGSDIDSNKMTTPLSYTWKGIEKGKYRFFYQTYLNGKLRSKVDGINPFTIGSPAKLVSTFETPINPLCHDGNGSVTINATGGTGNYLYKINTDPFKQFDMTTNIDNNTGIHSATQTIPLPSTITTNYTISVTDQEGCIEYK